MSEPAAQQAELPDGTRLRNFSIGGLASNPYGPGHLQWQTVDEEGVTTHWMWRYAAIASRDPDTDPVYGNAMLVLHFDFIGEPEVIATTDLRVPLPSMLPENRHLWVSAAALWERSS